MQKKIGLAQCKTYSKYLFNTLLLNQRNTALDKVGEVFALQHTVREQREVDDLAHQLILLANLLEALVALVT